MNETSASNANQLRRGGGKPFTKGEDSRRNTKGRIPGSRNFSTLIKTAVQRINKDNATPHDVNIVRKAIEQAEHGDRYARDFIVERIEGKAPQKIDMTSNGETIAPTAETVALANAALSQYIKSNAKPSSNDSGNLPV